MSLIVVKAGIFDTVQDGGRYGYQHLGIGPGGAMDLFSAWVGNALLGRGLNEATFEFHFPAAELLFEDDTIICITGADFSPVINTQPVPLYQPIAVGAGTLLKFVKHVSGMRCYVSLLNQLELYPWLNSYSTNVRAKTGGIHGRRLKLNDRIAFQSTPAIRTYLGADAYRPLGWKAAEIPGPTSSIWFTCGHEWARLSARSQTEFLNSHFRISTMSDRMGYRCAGPIISVDDDSEMISTAVTTGTVQLLPNGELIILMADRQTTGGYPRIAHVISAHIHHLAQMQINAGLQFVMTTVYEAEQQLIRQHQFIEQLQKTCTFKMRHTLC